MLSKTKLLRNLGALRVSNFLPHAGYHFIYYINLLITVAEWYCR